MIRTKGMFTTSKAGGFPWPDNVLNKPKSIDCKTAFLKPTCPRLNDDLVALSRDRLLAKVLRERQSLLMNMMNFLLKKA